jgi:hypothetical protein
MLSRVKEYVEISHYPLEKLKDTVGPIEENILESISLLGELQEFI